MDPRHLITTIAALAILGASPVAFAQSKAAPAEQKKSDMKGMDMKGMDMKGMDSGGGMHGAMMSSMKAMEAMPMSGNPDHDFAMMMKAHHQGAIDMAQVELKSGKDAKMRAMAKRVIEAQTKEIKELDQWLAAHK